MKWPPTNEQRRRLCEALLDWVAALSEAEPLPAGLDPTASAELPDLYGALREMEALRRDVQLQGRSFARLAEASKGASEQLDQIRLSEERAREINRKKALEAGRLQVIEGLIAANEGLQRSLGAARALRPRVVRGWWGARARSDAYASLVQALEMNLDTANSALRDLDVRELHCVGEPFDPHRMRAVEAADCAEGAAGTVIAVRRPGWLVGEHVLRHAEVRAVPARTTKETER